MPEKTYKARVELSLIVEFDVDAVHEDEAAATAEEILRVDSQNLIDTLNSVGYHVPNADVRCIEVNDYAESDE